MKKVFLVSIIVLLSFILLAACAQQTPAPTTAPTTAQTTSPKPTQPTTTKPAEPITFRAVQFLPVRAPDDMWMKSLSQKVSDKSNGQLIFKLIGGPEAAAPADQAKTVQTGALEMARTLYTYMESLIPNIVNFGYAEYSSLELRQNGAYDLFQPMCNKVGLYFLGNAQPQPPQTQLYVFTKKPMAKVEDFAGLRIAVPGAAPMLIFKALGSNPVMTPLSDTYTVMERGVVEAYLMTAEAAFGFGMAPLTKYIIDQPYTSCSDGIVINLNTWNKLPQNLKDAAIAGQTENERDFPDIYIAQAVQPAKDKLKAAGVEFIKLPDAERQKFYQTYQTAVWADAAKLNPEQVEQFKKLMTKPK